MAFLIKNQASFPGASGAHGQQGIVDQWIRVARATEDLPATAAKALFNVEGGICLVKLMIGRVTTVIQTQANNLKVTLNPDTGTSADVASNLDTSADEVGTVYIVEGDGTALIGVNAGQTWGAAGLPHPFLVNAGTIDIETSATNTGQVAWTVFYMPLEPGAFINVA